MNEIDREVSDSNRAYFPRNQAEWERACDALEIACLNEARYKVESERLRRVLEAISHLAPKDQPVFGYPFHNKCQFHIAFAIWSVAQVAREALDAGEDVSDANG